jgi:hypothetical protein
MSIGSRTSNKGVLPAESWDWLIGRWDMSSAQSALINEELVSALNALRIKHVDQRGQVLDHIRFRARGLRKAPPDHMAVQAMIAVLDLAPESVLASAEAVTSYPAAVDSRLNILRCLSALSMAAETASFARSLFDDHASWHVLAVAGSCLCNAGAIRAAEELLAPWASEADAMSDDVDRAWVARIWKLIQVLHSAGVEDGEFSKALMQCREILVAEGWPTADLEISPSVQGDAEAPLAIIEFFIDAEEDLERVLDVENNVLSHVSSNPLFQDLRLVVAVLPHTPEG